MSASPRRCSRPRPSARDAHGGEARIRAARFPARKTLEEFDFTFQRSIKKQVIEHLGQLDFLHAKENVVLLGPPGTGKTHLAIALSDPRLPGRPARPVPHRDRVGRAPRRRATPGPPRGRAQTPRTHPAAGLRRGRLHPVRPAGREPDVHARLPPLRAREPDRHLQQAVQRLGRDLRRRRRRRRDGRPARPPRRDPLPQGRQLPPEGPRPRPPPQSSPHTPTDPPPRSRRRLRAPLGATRSAPRAAATRGVNFQPAQQGQFSTGLDSSARGCGCW